MADVINSLGEISSLSTSVAYDYSEMSDKIELSEDFGVEFRHMFEIENNHVYCNIDEVDIDTKLIKKYAIGVTCSQTKNNHIRYDDSPGHNHMSTVKNANPPHHKHIGKNERIEGFSGELSDVIKGIEKILEK